MPSGTQQNQTANGEEGHSENGAVIAENRHRGGDEQPQ
jgi:hypothetical protein